MFSTTTKQFKKYTYSFYMVGNYDLASYVKRDLYQKLGGHHTRGSNKYNNVVCYSSYYSRNKLNNYIYHGYGRHTIPFENKTKMKKTSLSNYLDFVKDNFSSKYYVLTLWGHGYTWMENVPLYDKNEAKFENIDIHELKRALTQNKMDILIFETCAGMSIETIYELKKEVKYICGNCDYTSYEGIDHKNIIKCTQCPKQVCKKVVDNMSEELCPSYIQTNETVYIQKKLKKIVRMIMQKCSLENIIKIKKTITTEIIDDISIDLGCLLFYVIKYCKNKKIREEVLELQIFLKKNIYCVPKKKFKKYDCCGINIYFPRKATDYIYMRDRYRKLAFNKNNNWIDFLDLIHKKYIKNYIRSFS